MKIILSFVLLYHILLVQCAPASMHRNGKLSYEENKILQEKCGRFDVNSVQKSINSHRVYRNIAPWVVAVSTAINASNERMLHCSGTLISPRHVLAAKHCVLAPEDEPVYRQVRKPIEITYELEATINGTTVYFDLVLETGEKATNLRDFRFIFDDECGADRTLDGKTQCSTKNATVRRAVKAFSPNLRLLAYGIGNSDLLIFELDEPVIMGPNLYPACLSDRIPSTGTILDLYSFGRDGKKLPESFQGTLQHISVTKIYCVGLKTIDAMCIRSETQNTYNGDSGGGFTYQINGTNYVTGVVSGGKPATINYNDYGLTAVAPHLAWICEHVGICVNYPDYQLRPEIEIIAAQ